MKVKRNLSNLAEDRAESEKKKAGGSTPLPPPPTPTSAVRRKKGCRKSATFTLKSKHQTSSKTQKESL